MALPTNPQTLANYNLLNGGQAKVFVKNVSDILVSIYQFISNPSGFSNLLNGTGLLNASALVPGSILATNIQTSITDLGGPAGNSTIDTKQSLAVYVRVNLTAAISWTLTLNNLAQGASVYFRLINTSGAARTFTVLANNPTPTAYSPIILWQSATSSTLSTGVSVNNGAGINGFGMAAMQSGTPAMHMVGSIV